MDYHVGLFAFAPVGPLSRQDAREPRLRHAGAGKRPGGLQERRRGDEDHLVAAYLRAGFKKQRNIEEHHPLAAPARLADGLRLRLPHQRMQDRFKRLKRFGTADDHSGEGIAINVIVLARFGEKPRHALYRRTGRAEQTVDDGIGIAQGCAEPRELAGYCRFAHGDAAGKADD